MSAYYLLEAKLVVPTVTSEGLNKNCLLRLDFSMVSMSVTMTSPSPLASPIIAKFFNSSQPMAPAPTWKDCRIFSHFNGW